MCLGASTVYRCSRYLNEISQVAPIPVNIITGALGVGKTTAISTMLANKPSEEHWAVILNEFTDAGIDAITLASAARGAFDVRVVPGGCLCCTGEQDFRQALNSIVVEQRPQRILIEPTGIGHPGKVIEELRSLERRNSICLMSTIALLDPNRLHYFDSSCVERDQIDVADVLLLTKLDHTSEQQRAEFAERAQACFPAKRFVGEGLKPLLTADALAPAGVRYTFDQAYALPQRSGIHASEHIHLLPGVTRDVRFGSNVATARSIYRLARHACGWTLPREVTFDERKITRAFADASYAALLAQAERIKAILRTGVEHWVLLNVVGGAVTVTPCGWRQDSRIEVQLREGVVSRWCEWDAFLAIIAD
jgi:G3E family GTPase